MKANTSRRARFAFGSDPIRYARGRMSFSRWVVKWALDRTHFESGDHVLEIGAGTGQLTRELLAAGARVSALEPSDELANLFLHACEDRDLGSIEVIRETFEDYVSPNTFALVTAANSFHWIDPDVSYRKAAEILDPEGSVCLFWYFPILANVDTQRRANSIFEELGFAELMRDPIEYGKSLLELLEAGRNELDESGDLRCREWVLNPHHIQRSVDEYCDLIATYASGKDISDLRERILNSVLYDVNSVELVVHEYACVADVVKRIEN